MWPLIVGFWLLAALLLFANRRSSTSSESVDPVCLICGGPNPAGRSFSTACPACQPPTDDERRTKNRDGNIIPFEKNKRRKP
jgi:hypothetical protein